MATVVQDRRDSEAGVPLAGCATLRRRLSMPGNRGRRAGMTLVETVLGIGILFVVIAFALVFIINMVWRNRQIAMDVAGLQAVNHMVGEIEDIADAADPGDAIAFAILDHYKKMAGETLDIGPGRTTLDRVENDTDNGRFIYRFWVPSPGESRYLEDDPRFIPNYNAVGTVIFYLDEKKLNDEILPQFEWSDLSATPTEPTGIDLNLNGDLEDDLLTSYSDIKQLALRITVVFYSDELHGTRVYSTDRSILITRIKDATKGFDPTLPGI